jgi:hypothetical protein
MAITWLELKLESKDQLLAWVWHSIKFLLFQPCMLGISYFMTTLMGQSSWALVAQALPWYCFAGVSLSPYRHEPFLRLASLGQGTILDRRVIASVKMFLLSIFRLKLCNRIQNTICNKVQLSEHFICLNRVCDVLCVIISVIAPRNDSG